MSITRNKTFDIEISGFFKYVMAIQNGRHYFFANISFLDKKKEIKIKGIDNIVVSLPMFSEARNTRVVFIYKLDHWVIQKSKWPP